MALTPWTSLETVSVIVSLITPIIGGIIAWKLANLGKKIDKKQWTGQKVIEKRIAFYDEIVPELNDLYCYYHRIGNWKELTPLNIIEKKRLLDKQFNVYSHIFKNDILEKYKPFIDNCFRPFNGWGEDAKIKMNLSLRAGLPGWNEDWKDLFIEKEMVKKEVFNHSYFDLLEFLRTELEIKH